MAIENNYEISITPTTKKTVPYNKPELAPLKVTEPEKPTVATETSSSSNVSKTNVTFNNRAFREADSSNWNEVQEQQAMQRIAEVEASNIQTVEPQAVAEPPRNRTLGEFSAPYSKTKRYRQINSNLATLAQELSDKADSEDKGWSIGKAVNSGLAAIIGIATGGAVGLSIATSLATGLNEGAEALFNGSGDKRTAAKQYAQMAGNIQNYMSNLASRDTTILNTMDQIYSSMDNLRANYGSQFVDTMYNLYLAKSGMTNDAYSLLTGIFNTFENIGYGQVSADGQIFDTLTEGNQNLFNNIYAQLQLEDITSNKTLMDSMVQSLYGADTELAISLRGYENDLRTTILSSLNQQSQAVWSTKRSLEDAGTSARSENISATEQIGSAEAESASSGLRGGTTSNNANLARLSRDLGVIRNAANVASIIGGLKYKMVNAQLNASSTAYSYRMAQKKAVVGAFNASILSFNEQGRTAFSGERTGNYYLEEAQEEERQFTESFNNMAEADKDRIFEATRG